MEHATTPHTTERDLLVLHALRCAGFSGTGRLSEVTGLREDETESALIDLAVDGLVTRTPGAFGGWGLSGSGRTTCATRIHAELDATGARPLVEHAHEGFAVLNPELLDLCTAWQLRDVDGVPAANDHTDTEYDTRVLDLFSDLDGRLASVCAELSAHLNRFARYRVRLAGALSRARAGALDQVADGTDSYHSVWAQLHEDLLATLGVPRY
ncbi:MULTISPECIES: transcriptional regulator [unclassified Nocardiopsis]|uniref:transcriptional regulator n=1 Tax=unclassified Nocardiopsis TaxID=2649073 RepID=UPI0033D4BB27